MPMPIRCCNAVASSAPAPRSALFFTTLLLAAVHTSACSSNSPPESGIPPEPVAPSNGEPNARVDDVAGASVFQHHANATRDGHYVEPAFTPAAVATMHVDTTFRPTFTGHVYAQPLFAEDGVNHQGTFYVVTESNDLIAIDERGTIVWSKKFGASAQNSGAGCGNIHPLGITGTPVIDPASRTIFFSSVLGTTADGSGTISKHLIHAVSIDTGVEKAGWPVDTSRLSSGGIAFNSKPENQRGALLLFQGVVYVPYGGHFGDCGNFHGWVVGVPIDNPAGAKAYATRAVESGIWAVGGVSTDGVNLFATTGNSAPRAAFGQQESIVRLQPGPVFTDSAANFFTPANWQDLDNGDVDVGGSGPLIVDVPDGTPSKVVVGLGKDGKAYLANRDNLGGIARAGSVEGLGSAKVATFAIRNAPAAFTTAKGTFVSFASNNNRGQGVNCKRGTGALVTIRIRPGANPPIDNVWCADNGGGGSPIVTTTDAQTNAIVWTFGYFGTGRLQGLDGATGSVLVTSDQAPDAANTYHYFSSPIVAKGRIFVAGDGKLVAFKP